jgi:deoxycytidine triphosphate deaminase
MTLLTDTSINNIREKDKNVAEWRQHEQSHKKKLLIYPFEERCLTPVGYDLRVGNRYVKISSWWRSECRENLREKDEISISHNEIVAVETEEFIGMPQDKTISGIIVSKVSIVEEGLSHVSTSVDADYEGKLIITLTNHSKRKVRVKRKQAFCTLVFLKNKEPATRPCDRDPNKHFNRILTKFASQTHYFRKKLLFDIMNVLVPLGIIMYPLYRHFIAGVTVTEGEATLFVGLAGLLSVIIRLYGRRYLEANTDSSPRLDNKNSSES